MAAPVTMQSTIASDDPKIEKVVAKQEKRLASLVNRQYQLHCQLQYLSESGTWEAIKRKWSHIDTVEKLMRFRPVEVTEKKTNFIVASLWKATRGEPDYAKGLEKQIKICEEKNALLEKLVKEALAKGLSEALDNDWQNVKSLPENIETYITATPKVPAWGIIAFMALGCLIGRPCH